MEEKFHLLVALTRLVTVNDRNVDTSYFICQPGQIKALVSRLCALYYLIVSIYVNGHRVEASVTHNKNSSTNCNVEQIILLPEIKRRLANHLTTENLGFLLRCKKIVIQLYIKLMHAYRQALQVNDCMVVFAHYAKSAAKLLLFF